MNEWAAEVLWLPIGIVKLVTLIITAYKSAHLAAVGSAD